MPGSFQTSSIGGVIGTKGISPVRGFENGNDPYFVYPYTIAGVTRDGSGVALGNCTVKLYRTIDDSLAAVTTSDGSGNYQFPASAVLQHYIVAYLDVVTRRNGNY
jgi:hypothetical protein